MAGLDSLSYEGIEPGTYTLILPSQRKDVFLASQAQEEQRVQRGRSLFFGSAPGEEGPNARQKAGSTTYQLKESNLEAALDVWRGWSDGRAKKALGNTVPHPSERRIAASCHPPRKNTSSRGHLPEHIQKLEQVLTETYGSQTCISSVRELAFTRKDVKAVDIIRDGMLSTVWVFKADPEKTARELTIYKVAHDHGIPTGKPLAFDPEDKRYPYDVAILGGIVEHAGDSYESLFRRLALAPNHLFGTAEHVGRLMAQYHTALTGAADELASYGVGIGSADPAHELSQRLFAVIGHDPELEGLCSDLYALCPDNDVISHGDIHLRNIVTRKNGDSIDLNHFGVIDWESVRYASPYDDLWDFWVHHMRKARDTSTVYDYTFEDFSASYFEEARLLGLQVSMDAMDSRIHEILWNLYEIADPQRVPQDQGKAAFHIGQLVSAAEGLHAYDTHLSERLRDALPRIGERLHNLE